MNADQKNQVWLQGYACAVATSIRLEGCISTKEKELMSAGGLTLETCLAAKVEDYDMEVLFPGKALLDKRGKARE